MHGRSPRKGEARLHVTSGMSREAPQVLGGWNSEVIGKLYNKERSEEAAPGMRMALKRASGRHEVDRFAQELEESVTLVNDGFRRPVYGRRW